ncbi:MULTISPECIES: transposase [Serratia]
MFYTTLINCEVIELNIQPDHVHRIVIFPPQLSIWLE